MGERSKVYMTDLRCRPGVSLLNKLEKLMRTAGIGEINFERKLVAIKMHFGEPGNLAFLRPNYAKVVADVVKSLGGVPLTDCNTLYPGRRKNALEHLDAAYENGFSPAVHRLSGRHRRRLAGQRRRGGARGGGRSTSRPPRSERPSWRPM